MYDVARSGDTERTRIRGSGRAEGSLTSAGLLVVGVVDTATRFTSVRVMYNQCDW